MSNADATALDLLRPDPVGRDLHVQQMVEWVRRKVDDQAFGELRRLREAQWLRVLDEGGGS